MVPPINRILKCPSYIKFKKKLLSSFHRKLLKSLGISLNFLWQRTSSASTKGTSEKVDESILRKTPPTHEKLGRFENCPTARKFYPLVN
jgi:hypothetical protein